MVTDRYRVWYFTFSLLQIIVKPEICLSLSAAFYAYLASARDTVLAVWAVGVGRASGTLEPGGQGGFGVRTTYWAANPPKGCTSELLACTRTNCRALEARQ